MMPQRVLPWVILVSAIVYVLMATRPKKEDGQYDLQRLGAVPVSADGRVKPLDTVARNGLMIVSDRQSFRLKGKRQSAMRWLVDIIARPDQAGQYPVFRIDHPGVLSLMGLTSEDGKRFSYDAIMTHHEVIARQAHLANQVKSKQRSSYQRQVLELYSHVMLYRQLSRLDRPYMVVPLDPNEQWQPMAQALGELEKTGEAHPSIAYVSNIMSAYRDQNPQLFNQESARYLQFLEDRIPQVTRKARYEVFFNQFQPFYRATILYVLAFLLGCLSFLFSGLARLEWSRALGRTTAWLILLTLMVHTFGLVLRMYLQGRPPVTNLYSSAVFIGWGCVILAMFTEWLFRLGLGSITAAGIGFVTLIVAHNLGTDGDTMGMMQAVLDSNFWLATHVVTVSIGYSATFLAGFLAIVFILLGVLTPMLKADLFKAMGRMVYGVVCFAALLSFVGTVLGGIWADQSWGRFWGWDPKENGAVLIVLMNMLILHARWGGMVRERGMMVLAVAGNIVTSWSWFGTNMLGVGLHSYGFMDSAVFWMLIFVASQLVLMGVGMLPMNRWRSIGGSKRPVSA